MVRKWPTGDSNRRHSNSLLSTQENQLLVVSNFRNIWSGRPEYATCRYISKRRDESVLKSRIKEFTDTRVHYGYRRVLVMLRRESYLDIVQRVYRIYREAGMTLRHKQARRNKTAKLRKPNRQPMK